MNSAEGLFFDGGQIRRIRVDKPCPKEKVSSLCIWERKRKIILGIKRGKKWENENLGKIIGAEQIVFFFIFNSLFIRVRLNRLSNELFLNFF
jgi:hypothetical protein